MRRSSLLIVLCLLVSAGVFSVSANDRDQQRWIRSKPPIDSIVVDGNSYFKDSEIKKRLYSRTRNPWRAIRGDRRYRVQRETYRRDTLEVKYLYLTNGFLGVKVSESFELLPTDSAALVRVTVDEGRQFRYGEKTVTGNAEHAFIFHCQKVAERLKQGQPINLLELRRAVFDMKTHMANHGYPYAEINYHLDTINQTEWTPVSFHLQPDSLVRFGNVIVEGNSRFPEYAARRELKLKPGAIYRREDILESRRRLYESGYFSTLRLTMADSISDRLTPDFLLQVRERKARYLSFRTGAGQSEVRDLIWSINGEFGKRNFLGSRRYDLLTEYSFSLGSGSRLITHRYRLRFTEPWFLGLRMPLSLSFEMQPRIKDPVNDFDKRSWSASFTSWKWLGEKTRANLGIEYQFVKISGVPEEQVQELKELTDNTARRKIFAGIRRDSRDNLFNPRRGVVVDWSGEVYGGFLGGDENFFKIQSSWSRYEVVWPGWTAATRIRGSWVEPFGESDEVPLDEVIYLGGAGTVRSFNENQLGRFTIGDTPVGARYTLVFNQEFRWRTLQIFKVIPVLNDLLRTFPLWQSIFIDAGNGFRHSSEMRFDNMAYAYGTGFQIMSPAGPIRIDYARRIVTDSFDYADRWHFTILYAF